MKVVSWEFYYYLPKQNNWISANIDDKNRNVARNMGSLFDMWQYWHQKWVVLNMVIEWTLHKWDFDYSYIDKTQ